MTVKEFSKWLRDQKVTRKVDEVILHHTWRPTKAQYRGKETIEGIRAHHKSQGWKDIGYHLLIAPDGEIWLGRPLNEVGAHTVGRNSRSVGVCLIGNFDEEKLEEPQKGVAIAVLAALLQKFNLTVKSLNFHRDYAQKTCPGKLIDKGALRALVATEIAKQRG